MCLARNYYDSDKSVTSRAPKIGQLKAHRNAYGQRTTEAQEQQLERKLTKLCQAD